MDPATTAIALLLKDYGWPGAVALLGIVIVYLYKENQKLQVTCRDDGRVLLERTITAIRDAAEDRAKMGEVLSRVSETLNDVAKAVVHSEQARAIQDTHWKGWASRLDDKIGGRADAGGRMNGGSP